jgi:inner membrane protein
MEIVFWHWLTLGMVLILAEVVMPGTFLLWPGIAALLTGVLAYLTPSLGWHVHAVVFALLAVAAALAGRKVYGRLSRPSDEPDLNRRGLRYVGQVHTLGQAIVDGGGRLKLGDGTWKVLGPDLPAGTRVRIVGVDGIALRVERAD